MPTFQVLMRAWSWWAQFDRLVKNCAICCRILLSKRNLLTDTHHVNGLGYKFLFFFRILWKKLLHVEACEEQTSINREHLEAFMLTSTEREILVGTDTDNIVEKVLRNLLTFLFDRSSAVNVHLRVRSTVARWRQLWSSGVNAWYDVLCRSM